MSFAKWFVVYFLIILGLRILYIENEMAEYLSSNLQSTVKFVYEAF